MYRSKGFSLLEILVAFSIMAIALGILLNIFSAGVNNAVVAEDYIIATQIAEGLMARTGVETTLEPGENSGIEDEKYRWRVSVNRLPELTALAESDQQQTALMEVDVTVEWGDEKGRQVELHSIKLGPAL